MTSSHVSRSHKRPPHTSVAHTKDLHTLQSLTQKISTHFSRSHKRPPHMSPRLSDLNESSAHTSLRSTHTRLLKTELDSLGVNEATACVSGTESLLWGRHVCHSAYLHSENEIKTLAKKNTSVMLLVWLKVKLTRQMWTVSCCTDTHTWPVLPISQGYHDHYGHIDGIFT